MLTGQPITILGAGIAGLATSIALARQGADVRILEQSPQIAEVGAGLQISPNGLAVLDALGLGARMRQTGLRAEAVTLRDYRRGRQVLRLDLARHAPDQTFLLLHRADLIDVLAEAAREAGVAIELGRQVVSVTQTGQGARLAHADGSNSTAPLVIGADGLHSRLRVALNGDKPPFFTGQVAWRAIVPAWQVTRPEVTVHMAPGRHVVTYPLRAGSLINIVAVEEREAWAMEGWSLPGNPDDLRRAFHGFEPRIADLLARVEAVSLWGLHRHPVAERWHGTCTALVGDAAHPTLPFLAQGANMALEDAWVLADCLATLPREGALPAYQKRRRDRAARVIEAANANARNYHLRGPVIRRAAHAALRLGGLVAPARMLRRFDWIYRYDPTRP